MKKFLAVLLAVCFVFCLAACGNKPAEDNNVVTDNQGESDVTPTGDENTNGDTQNTENADLKVGLILVGDENEGYTYAHIKGIQEAAKELGMTEDQLVWKYTIPEDATCTETALDLVDQGCNLIISNSYGHQSFMEEAASQNPEVTFVSMTGDTAAKSGLNNFCNAFTHIFESRYGIKRRNHTIHNRMREYLYALTHDEALDTVILETGDGMAISVKKE